METQCQHLTMTQQNNLLKLLHKSEEMFDGTLGTCKTDPVEFKLKEYDNPFYLQPYPVPKIHEAMFKKEVVLNVKNDS